MVAQIDTMWTGNDGMTYFNGPWFVMPLELPPHQQGKSRAENPMRKNRWKKIQKHLDTFDEGFGDKARETEELKALSE